MVKCGHQDCLFSCLELSSHHCCSVILRKMGTNQCNRNVRSCTSQTASAFVTSSAATIVLRSCVERSFKRDGEWTCAEPTAHICKQVLMRPCTDSFLGLPGNAFDVTTSFASFSVSGLAFVEAQRSDRTRTGKFDSNRSRHKDTALNHVLNTHARSHRRIDSNFRNRALQSHTQQELST